MFSANPEEKNPGDKQVPHLIVTFQVRRAYQGILGPEVQVRTGLGGGDGARFAPGLIYLVYASKLSDGELGVSTCSPGGRVGNENVQVDLRYLRKERPTKSDLEPWRPWSVTKPTNLEQRKTEEFKKHCASLTGKICRKVVRQNVSGPVSGAVYFLYPGSFSHGLARSDGARRWLVLF
jgi:hypothetical protein